MLLRDIQAKSGMVGNYATMIPALASQAYWRLPSVVVWVPVHTNARILTNESKIFFDKIFCVWLIHNLDVTKNLMPV